MSALLNFEDITLADYERMLTESLDNFLQCWVEYSEYYGAIKSFRIRGEVPQSFTEMLAQLVDLYSEKIDLITAAELLYLANESNGFTPYIDSPSAEFAVDATDKQFLKKAPTYYAFNAVTLFNSMLPTLQKDGMEAVELEDILKLQKAIEHTNSICLGLKLIDKFSKHISPENKRKQASNGGKARAAKLYGNTKAYVTSRFKEIRSKNKTINMSQIAQKIAGELEENPIRSDEPLTNPYDTIYRWVRAMNKVL